MQKAYNLYYNLGYWFLLFIVLVVAGFYTSYFSVFFQPTAPLIHVHFTLGPTVDRIIFFGFKLEKLPDSLPIELAAFFIADAVLALLLWKDYKDKRPTKTLLTSLVIFIIGQVLYFTIPGSEAWQHFVTFIMKPKP